MRYALCFVAAVSLCGCVNIYEPIPIGPIGGCGPCSQAMVMPELSPVIEMTPGAMRVPKLGPPQPLEIESTPAPMPVELPGGSRARRLFAQSAH